MPSEPSVVPLLSVIIVSYNTCDLTLKCLADLYTDLGELPADVILVDNGSVDQSVAAVRAQFPTVRIIEIGYNAGFAAANNVAMARAKGDLFLLLNSDAFITRGSIKALSKYMVAHPDTAVLGPRLLNSDGTLQRSCYKFPTPFRAFCEHSLLTAAFPNNSAVGDFRAWPHDHERDVDFVIGACMMVRKSAVDEVGILDENFFMYSEETDWCKRFRIAGWTVAFTPVANVIHLNGASGRRQSSKVFNEFRRSAEYYTCKHHGRAALWIYRVFLIFGSCLRILLFTAFAIIPSRRTRSLLLVRQWSRILSWNIGMRGEGLRPIKRTETSQLMLSKADG